MKPTRDQIRGCLLGLAAGDALGAPFEGGILERLVWRLIGRANGGKLRWTDDTRMSLDIVESLLARGAVELDDIAQRFARSYRWSRGYGPGTAKILKRIRTGMAYAKASTSVYPNGSYGNGAAMRTPVLALVYLERDALLRAARDVAAITHVHPLGVEGAVLIALATRGFTGGKDAGDIIAECREELREAEMLKRLDTILRWLGEGASPTAREVAKTLGNGTAAHLSAPTALYIACRHRAADFSSMIQFGITCGGDVDTICAMAGALWGAANGCAAIPAANIEEADAILNLADLLSEKFGS